MEGGEAVEELVAGGVEELAGKGARDRGRKDGGDPLGGAEGLQGLAEVHGAGDEGVGGGAPGDGGGQAEHSSAIRAAGGWLGD